MSVGDGVARLTLLQALATVVPVDRSATLAEIMADLRELGLEVDSGTVRSRLDYLTSTGAVDGGLRGPIDADGTLRWRQAPAERVRFPWEGKG